MVPPANYFLECRRAMSVLRVQRIVAYDRVRAVPRARTPDRSRKSKTHLRILEVAFSVLIIPRLPPSSQGDSGISQARSRLGAEPLQRLYEAVVGPIALPPTKGAWYRQCTFHFLASLIEATVQGGFDFQSGGRARPSNIPQHDFQRL